MLYQLISYIKFFFGSTNAHGVHSPFVYDLVTQCFYDRTNYTEYELLQKHRDQLLANSQTIEITDFGEGSRIFSSNSRPVNQIAKHAGISVKRQRLLFRLARYFSSENILELGTSVGLATAGLALGTKESSIHSVEGCEATSAVARNLFEKFQLKNIVLHTATFDTFFENNTSTNYDLVYVDGNHSKESTLQYFHQLLPMLNNNSVLIFDDIYWSKEMTAAWNEICLNELVTVSIDGFYWGFVFFRKEQPKQHFKIRL